MKRRELFLLTCLNFLNYLDRYLVAAALPAIIRDISLGGVSIAQVHAGWLVGAFVPGYILFSPVFGYLGDRYSRPRLMALGVFIWSSATILSGLTGDFYVFLFSRVLVGVGEASFGAMVPGYVKDREQNPAQVNRVLSIFYSAIPIGSALGYVVGGYFSGQHNWQTAFFVGGLPGVLLAFSLLTLKEVEGRRTPVTGMLGGLKELWVISVLWVVIGAYALNTFALNGVAAFVTSYGVSLGFTLDEIGIAFGIVLVCAGAIGTLGGGMLASRLAEKSKNPAGRLIIFAGVATLISSPFLLAGFLVNQPILFLMLCFCAEVLIFAASAPVNSMIVLVCPAHLVTLAQGMTIFVIHSCGSFIAPAYVGYVADSSSLKIALASLSAFLLLSGVIWTIVGLKGRLSIAHS